MELPEWRASGQKGQQFNNYKGLEVETGLMCLRPAWQGGQHDWNRVNQVSIMEMSGRQAGPDQAGAFRPWQKFWISFQLMGSLGEAYCRGVTGLISDLERSWAAEWSKGCRKQEWKLGNASGGQGKSFGGRSPILEWERPGRRGTGGRADWTG